MGVDWKGLTIEEDNFSAVALMESYNKVHQDLDGGDKFLSKVNFEGISMGLGDSAEDDVLESDDEDEALEQRRKPPPAEKYGL
jgi:hypothetical protein